MRAILVEDGKHKRVILNNLSRKAFDLVKLQCPVDVLLNFEMEDDRRIWGQATISRFLPVEGEEEDML